VAARLAHDGWPSHAVQLEDVHDELVAATGLPAPPGPPRACCAPPGVRGRLGVPGRSRRQFVNDVVSR
jgi:uncharacterized protein YqjF (DUF2071 family)